MKLRRISRYFAHFSSLLLASATLTLVACSAKDASRSGPKTASEKKSSEEKAALLEQFAGRELAQVSDAELPAFVRVINYRLPSVGDDKRLQTLRALDYLLRVLAVETRARNTPYANVIEDELIARLQALVGLKVRYARGKPGLEPDMDGDPTVMRMVAEAATQTRRWLDARLLQMPDRKRLAAIRALMGRDMNCERCLPLPALDHVGLALEVFAMGRTEAGRASLGAITSDNLVCPYERYPQGQYGPVMTPGNEAGGCGDSLAKDLTYDDASATRFAALLAQGVDDTFMLSALSEGQPKRLFAALAAHPDTLRQGMRVAVSMDSYGRRSPREAAWAAASALWPKVPSARGALLLAIADQTSRSGRESGYVTDRAWERFEKDFGMRVDEALFVAMLREGPVAMERAPSMWRALGAIRSPMRVIEPFLDGYLDTRAVDARRTVIGPLLERMCEAGDREGVAQLVRLVGRRSSAGRPVPALPPRWEACSGTPRR